MCLVLFIRLFFFYKYYFTLQIHVIKKAHILNYPNVLASYSILYMMCTRVEKYIRFNAFYSTTTIFFTKTYYRPLEVQLCWLL